MEDSILFTIHEDHENHAYLDIKIIGNTIYKDNKVFSITPYLKHNINFNDEKCQLYYLTVLHNNVFEHVLILGYLDDREKTLGIYDYGELIKDPLYSCKCAKNRFYSGLDEDPTLKVSPFFQLKEHEFWKRYINEGKQPRLKNTDPTTDKLIKNYLNNEHVCVILGYDEYRISDDVYNCFIVLKGIYDEESTDFYESRVSLTSKYSVKNCSAIINCINDYPLAIGCIYANLIDGSLDRSPYFLLQ